MNDRTAKCCAAILREIVPPALWDRSAVVGSAAVDFDKAKDVDVWVWGGVDPLEDWGVMSQALPDMTPEEQRTDYVKQQVKFRGLLDLRISKPIHIMVTSYDTLDRLLQDFDLSVCMRAICPDGSAVEGSWFSPPEATIRVVNWLTPKETLKRYRKLCRRYEQKPNPRLLEVLQREASR